MSYKLVKPTPMLVDKIFDNVRPMDLLELGILGNPRVALHKMYQSGLDSKILMIDGVPILIIGITLYEIDSHAAMPWLIATCDYRKAKRFMLKDVKTLLKESFTKYKINLLLNWVVADNTKAVSWLRWLGFHIGKVQRMRGVRVHSFSLNESEA